MRIGKWGCAAIFALTASRAFADVPITCVAYFNMPAPGGGPNFTSFDHDPLISLAGTITFIGTNGFDPDNEGVWSGTASQLTLLAHAAQPIPNNTGTLNFITNAAFVLDSPQGGVPVFEGSYEDAQLHIGAAVWQVQNHVISLVAASGAPAPGTSGANFNGRPANTFTTPSGNYGFDDMLIGGDTTAANNTGIWSSTNGGGLQLVARLGTQAAGLSGGVQWQTIYGGELGLPDGSVLFKAATNDGRNGYWSSNGVTTTPLAINNSPVPGLPAGNNFGSVQQPTINPLGDVLFYDGNIWLKNASGFHKSVAVGQAAPGGGTFTLINSLPLIANDDTILFQAKTSKSVTGLYRTSSSGIQQVAAIGQQAPGLPTGTTIYRIDGEEMAPTGAIAFLAEVESGQNVTFNYLYGCFPGGSPILLAGEGTKLPTTGNSFATVEDAYLYAADISDISATQFDSNGDLVFTIQDTNLTNEVYVVQLPEPGELLLFILILPLFRRRRG